MSSRKCVGSAFELRHCFVIGHWCIRHLNHVYTALRQTQQTAPAPCREISALQARSAQHRRARGINAGDRAIARGAEDNAITKGSKPRPKRSTPGCTKLTPVTWESHWRENVEVDLCRDRRGGRNSFLFFAAVQDPDRLDAADAERNHWSSDAPSLRRIFCNRSASSSCSDAITLTSFRAEDDQVLQIDHRKSFSFSSPFHGSICAASELSGLCAAGHASA